MKLTFEVESITLSEARIKSEHILAAVLARRPLDRLDVAEVCAYVLEPRRKTEKPKDEDDES